MKVLVVCSDFPYPADHGGRVDTWGRIKIMSELGWDIDLAVCGKYEPSPADLEAVKQVVNGVYLCGRSTGFTDLLSPLPLQVQSRKRLRSLKVGSGYDHVLLEGDYVYPILHNSQISGANIVLRVHNNESAYFKSLGRSARKAAHKLYYLMESIKFAGLQKKLAEHVDKYLFISSKEYDAFKNEYPHKGSLFLPPPITRETFETSSFTAKNVVFIGSLFMPNNREAVEWYLKHVHPRLLNEEGYKLIIAGNSRGQGTQWITDYGLSRIEVHDTPKSLDDIYRSGYLFINPMRNGAGVKLKTIEAIQNGLPVVSTSVGCEGTGLVHREHIMIADQPDDFCSAIKSLLDDRAYAGKLLTQSQNYIRKHYDHKAILSGLFGGGVHAQREPLIKQVL
ncbi:glycosyltransferase family 4 protein [Paenibacillus tarimensis]|uniref:glycosyltransferase family 4 protein n=1 Tax=Paenibacillus tarimensis TaxID=416012 RepID=UPI001F177436|nr:glycosyltransferase family 4 protein [Paenibacillus tarimensis]MCF2944236.1 glycosyltransferase family 4 protein [Paenibacillus tarimensis]